MIKEPLLASPKGRKSGVIKVLSFGEDVGEAI